MARQIKTLIRLNAKQTKMTAAVHLSDFEAFSQDLRWLSDNLDALRPKYENKYVLVKDKNIIAASANYDQLLDEAMRHKVDVSKAVIERIIPENIQLIF